MLFTYKLNYIKKKTKQDKSDALNICNKIKEMKI